MQRPSILSNAGLMGFLALASLIFDGGSRAMAQAVDCTNGRPGPKMTIVIYNNSTESNIYPILFAGAESDTDQWMEACFKVPANQIQPKNNFPYPRASQFRMYINCCAPGENGLPPGGSATIVLPFYSPLVATINPTIKGPAQFIDWWQGGGINVFKGPKTSTTPPAIVQGHWTEDNSDNRSVTPNSNAPTCSAGCNLHFFSTPISIANWEPQQLIEYTLGAAPANAKQANANQPFYLWVPDNVDYDLSNVNFAFLPAAIEPFGNTLINTCCAIGWVGSTASLEAVDAALDQWRASTLGVDWPLYVDQSSTANPKATVPRKVPSALEIFLNFKSFDDTSNYSPAPSQSPPIIRMKTLWQNCTSGGNTYNICGRIKDVTSLLQANYNNYVNVYNTNQQTWTKDWGCTAPPVMLSDQIMLAHLYGWGPFNADSGCSSTVNLLEQTPGYTDPTAPTYYATVKAEFDQLQYWFNVLNGQYGQWSDSTKPDYGQFDPYVALVHGQEYVNAPFTYAYSVDDAVGNMQTDGTGLIIAVGGPQNLPNPDHVTPEALFTFGYESPYHGGITFDQYGRCIPSPNTPTVSYFTTFVVPIGIDGAPNSVENCQITLKDSQNRNYTFKLKGFPTDFPTPVAGQNNWPNAQQISAINRQFIDCSGNSNPDVQLSWCQLIFTYQQIDLTNPHLPTKYYVIMAAPAPCDRDPAACQSSRQK